MAAALTVTTTTAAAARRHENPAARQGRQQRDNHCCLTPEAHSVLLGMVEHCLNVRACLGMDEGYKDFENERDEHDFVKELRALLDAPSVNPRPFGYWLTPKTCSGLAMFQRELIEDPVLTASVAEYFHVTPLYDTPSAQPQGEPVATVMNQPYGMVFTGYDESAFPVGVHVDLYAEQPAPVADVLPERSNQDYAIEHAEYMALSADDVLAKFQAYALALLAVDEGGDDGEGELLENIDSARSDLQESLVELRSMVYEFRKRSAKSR